MSNLLEEVNKSFRKVAKRVKQRNKTLKGWTPAQKRNSALCYQTLLVAHADSSALLEYIELLKQEEDYKNRVELKINNESLSTATIQQATEKR